MHLIDINDSKKVSHEILYHCERCNITSQTGMCPCPRGSCEAKEIGIVETTIKIILSKDENRI